MQVQYGALNFICLFVVREAETAIFANCGQPFFLQDFFILIHISQRFSNLRKFENICFSLSYGIFFWFLDITAFSDTAPHSFQRALVLSKVRRSFIS